MHRTLITTEEYLSWESTLFIHYKAAAWRNLTTTSANSFRMALSSPSIEILLRNSRLTSSSSTSCMSNLLEKPTTGYELILGNPLFLPLQKFHVNVVQQNRTATPYSVKYVTNILKLITNFKYGSQTLACAWNCWGKSGNWPFDSGWLEPE